MTRPSRPWRGTPTRGYKAVRAQCGVPGVPHVYGIGTGDHYEPARPGLPPEERWSSERYLALRAPVCSRRLRREFGPDLHLLHDVHHRLTPIEAARLGRALEPYHLFWLEDPTPAEDQDRFRLIRQHTTTPLAVGEVFNSIFDCQRLIEEQLIDYIRASGDARGRHQPPPEDREPRRDCTRCARAATGRPTSSPVSLAAALHVDLSVHNFGIQEYMPHSPETDRVFPHAYRFEAA